MLVHFCFWNYEGVGNDMIEIIPALKKMLNPGLYSRDFYLGFTNSLLFHERSFALYFLTLFHAEIPIALLSIYTLALFFFIFGLLKLTSSLIDNFSISILTVIILLFPMRYTAVGANEMFYNMATNAVFSKTIIVWALFYLIQRKSTYGYLLLIPASLFHILAGFQIFIIAFLSDLKYKVKKVKFYSWIKPILFYLAIIIPNIFLILYSRKTPHSHDNSFIELIEFRLGHHFFIEYSSFSSILLYLFLYMIGIFLWKKYNPFVSNFYIFQGIILIIYILLVSQFRLELGIQLQWLKTTIWIETFSILAIMKWICSIQGFSNFYTRNNFMNWVILLFICVLSLFKQKEDSKLLNEEILLAKWANKNTNKNALFVYPPSFTRFKSISERSSWIDFKCISHQKAYFIPWFDRVQKVFKIDLADRRKNKNLIEEAYRNYNQLTEAEIENLFTTQNINYIILPIRLTTSNLIKAAYSTDSFVIYMRK
ncbi:MAG: hypothetical protein IT267_05840 [Saprospiraceae bacterium]|nr:hypothetical protein [Saprospiraceae bacterium]